MFRTVLSFDMRAPEFGAPAAELYDAALDMCAYGDEIGIEAVIFPEHHASEDGYNPVPALMAAAASARTKRMEMILGAIVLPLHDPVEVAETIAVTDHVSGGRLTTTLAAGYVEAELRMFGKSLDDRARLMDEGLEVVTRALAGERSNMVAAKYCSRPLPRSRPPKILVGGGVPAAARRAAKYGLGLWVLQPETMPGGQEDRRPLQGRVPQARQGAGSGHVDASRSPRGARSRCGLGADRGACASPGQQLRVLGERRRSTTSPFSAWITWNACVRTASSTC